MSKIKIKFIEPRQVRDHNGAVIENYKVGQVVEFTEASARHWLTRHVATEVVAGGRRGKPEASPSLAPVKPSGDELIADIAGAIDTLDEDADFTAAGDPNVASLEKALGYNITATERDAGFTAWCAANPEEPAAVDPAAQGDLGT
jgi:hypothetical protein